MNGAGTISILAAVALAVAAGGNPSHAQGTAPGSSWEPVAPAVPAKPAEPLPKEPSSIAPKSWAPRDLGAHPDANPVTPADLAATLFWRLGLDPSREIQDLASRPYRLAEGQPIRAVFG